MARILVVDDEEAIRHFLREVLTEAGHMVVEAPNGRRALERLRDQPIDLVVTDIIMPEVDGLELLLTLRKTLPEVKAIAISGYTRESPTGTVEYLTTAKAFGSIRALSKPFSRAQVLQAVEEALEEPRAEPRPEA